ncbi:MAG: reverse transcriptase [Chitinophagaceae bacterium]|nr:reverse transcriptase [Chitinophagaceae bacterium]
MKRHNNIFERICSLENLREADRKARKDKAHKYGVKLHDQNREQNILELQNMLLSQTYRTSEYNVFTVYEPKERMVYQLPYYPDRITHHAILNQLEPYFVRSFTADTYSCIKGRGIHLGAKKIIRALKNVDATRYCLQIDIRKFYPSIDHDILKNLLSRKFKDRKLLWLLDEIIDSADGVPIGNYLSQFFSNYYLTPFDHWLKEVVKVGSYFRYMDDMAIFASNKPELHGILALIREYLSTRLNLDLKSNYQIFPVASRGVDMLGYVFYHEHVLLRPGIKKNFARKMAKGISQESFAGFMGWAKHCNSRHLIKKLTNERFQPIERITTTERIYRNQDRYAGRFQPAYNSPCIQGSSVEVP